MKKLWIVDVDTKDEEKIKKLDAVICNCRSAFPVGHPIAPPCYFDNVVAKIPTPHGYHLITHGFDVGQFKILLNCECSSMFTDEEQKEICTVKKDNPTILYFNDLG